jgi:hypothetical protein
MPGDLDGLPFTFDLKEKIAADRLLGFDEGTIDDGVALLSRDDLALVGQRAARRSPALLKRAARTNHTTGSSQLAPFRKRDLYASWCRETAACIQIVKYFCS